MNLSHPLARPSVSYDRQTSANPLNWLWLTSLGLLTALLGIWVVGNFIHPLADGTDTRHYEYARYYLHKNLSFNPFPHVDLVNNQAFYPYGVNQVFLDWGIERDYWYMLGYRLFDGPGPYLQFYYLLTLVITAVVRQSVRLRCYIPALV